MSLVALSELLGAPVRGATGAVLGRVREVAVAPQDHPTRIAYLIVQTADGQRVVLPKDDIEEMRVSGISLMPESLLQGLNDQEVRDLFAYLRSSQPLFEPK